MTVEDVMIKMNNSSFTVHGERVHIWITKENITGIDDYSIYLRYIDPTTDQLFRGHYSLTNYRHDPEKFIKRIQECVHVFADNIMLSGGEEIEI